MALTLTLKSATQHSLKYEFVIPNQQQSKSQADLINDCAAGPLRALLDRSYTAAEWAELPKGKLLSVFITPFDGQGPIGVVFAMGGNNEMRVQSTSMGGGAVVELRFHHSISR